MKSKRFLVRYEGPIYDFVAEVNAKKVIFHPIVISNELHKIGEVWDQNAFNFILQDYHITPYVPCAEALNQLNKLQKARDEAKEEADKQNFLSNLVSKAAGLLSLAGDKAAQIAEAEQLISSLASEIRDVEDKIPEIENQIKDLTAKPKKDEPKKE